MPYAVAAFGALSCRRSDMPAPRCLPATLFRRARVLSAAPFSAHALARQRFFLCAAAVRLRTVRYAERDNKARKSATLQPTSHASDAYTQPRYTQKRRASFSCCFRRRRQPRYAMPAGSDPAWCSARRRRCHARCCRVCATLSLICAHSMKIRLMPR